MKYIKLFEITKRQEKIQFNLDTRIKIGDVFLEYFQKFYDGDIKYDKYWGAGQTRLGFGNNVIIYIQTHGDKHLIELKPEGFFRDPVEFLKSNLYESDIFKVKILPLHWHWDEKYEGETNKYKITLLNEYLDETLNAISELKVPEKYKIDSSCNDYNISLIGRKFKI